MDNMPVKIKVIIGSTRPNRFSEKPAYWIFDEIKKISGVEVELLDLRDYPLPFFDEPLPPIAAGGKYTKEEVKKWAAKIADGDGFIIVTPEYNHGYSAVLKNAMDYVYFEWNRKAVGFVSYGSVLGARAVEQLREVSIELRMAPIRNSIHIPTEIFQKAGAMSAGGNPELFNRMKEGDTDHVREFLDDLIWMARALKNARENK